jgi:hypothetical protein
MKASSAAVLVASIAFLFCLQTFNSLAKLSLSSSSNQDDSFFLLPIREFSDNSHGDMTSPLHDKTLRWNATISRAWSNKKGPRPPAVVTLSSLYWNHPNQTFGLTHFRTKRSTQLLQGVLNHPWFHPTAWDDLVEGKWSNDSTRIYAFFDYETVRAKINISYFVHGTCRPR